MTKHYEIVESIVGRYLIDKPELEMYREDLIQEGVLAYLEYEATFNPALGNDLSLHCYMGVKYALSKYARGEAKHFRKDPVDHDSPYWDLSEYGEIDEIPDEERVDEQTAMDLRDILGKLDLTERQIEVLSVWLENGEATTTGAILGVSHQAVSKLIAHVIDKAKELVAESDSKW